MSRPSRSRQDLEEGADPVWLEASGGSNGILPAFSLRFASFRLPIHRIPPPISNYRFYPVRYRLHRSILFWFGLLVFLFLGWAWRQSVVAPGFVRLERLVVTNAAHRMEFQFSSRRTFGELGKASVAGDTWRQDYFPRPSLMLVGRGDPFTRLKLPHWLLLSICSALWVVLLLGSWFWHRKRHRPSEPSA